MTFEEAREVLKDSGLIGKINKKSDIERWYIPTLINRPLLEIDFNYKEIITAKYTINGEEISIGGRYDFMDAGFKYRNDSYKAMIDYAFNIWKEVRKTVKEEKMKEIKNCSEGFEV